MQPEGTFSFTGTDENGTLGTEIQVYVNGDLNTKIHTSCSQPIYPGLEFDDFEVVEGESLKGGALETPAPEFVPLEVTLTDQFETAVFEVKKRDRLYNPANKNDEEINDPNTHLVGYKIKRVKGQPKHEKQTNILVEDQFGQLFVDTQKPGCLLVPSLKDLVSEIPDENVPGDFPLDHFKCYKVKVTKGTPGFPEGIQAFVVDQFGQPKLFDVKKPTMLCTPVDKGEGRKNPEAHLMCYAVKPAEGQLEHVKVLGIHVNNQFGPLQLDTKKEEELCVPSEKILP